MTGWGSVPTLRVAAVVPVKALEAAKSRLSAVLGEAERAALALWLLERVVAALRASGGVADLAVVSPDEAALDHARDAGVVALRQAAGDLNAAIEQGRRWAIGRGAEALFVALGDLPLLTGTDVRDMIALAQAPESNRGGDGDGTYRRGREGRGRGRRFSLVPSMVNKSGAASRVVLAPDRAGTGTNALLLRPPEGMPFAFGAGSYARHRALARKHRVAVATFRAAGMAFDVDGPADLEELRTGGLWTLVGERAVQGRTD
jgi:2-phospho-L-lactate guanylyltransferase